MLMALLRVLELTLLEFPLMFLSSDEISPAIDEFFGGYF